MGLVDYSDSDSETQDIPQIQQKKSDPTPEAAPAKPPSAPSIADRSNPRKIRVALPEIKPETAADGDQESEDGPVRKKARTGGGGGAFSAFNSMLPAPKRQPTITADKDKKGAGHARKPFGLKTGATPGFDRGADVEMRQDQAFGAEDDEDIPKPGSLQTNEEVPVGTVDSKPEGDKGEVKLKGNAMMFKPLSVGRNSRQKKPPKTPTSALPAADELRSIPQQSRKQSDQKPQQAAPQPTLRAAPPKPKVSLFSMSSEDSSATTSLNNPAESTTYQPLVYTPTPDAPPAGPELPPDSQPAITTETFTQQQQPQTLDNIADDLNLSRAQRRHLFGRHGDTSKSPVIKFNTDKEYIANQELAQETDLAAMQHNPVRAIAPGKHTLQQLVHAASNQREALEESFATGRRNKKEAGSKYGW